MSEWSTLEFVKAAIFYLSYLAAPIAVYLGAATARRTGAGRILAAAGLVVVSTFLYARFIEPRILITVEHETTLERCFADAGALRVAIFSDMHEGMFANAMPIRRIASRADKANADLVLIPGDFVYFLTRERYEPTFAAFGGMKTPVYAVLGNHDLGLPGPDVRAALGASLSKIGVTMIDDRSLPLEFGAAKIQLTGLSDVWGKNQNRKLLEIDRASPKIVLTHNPGTILELTPEQRPDLMISGHTHGGQVFIPGVTCKLVTFACRVTRYGFADTKGGRVFVTSGTGMVGLPLRFNTPPRIDVVNMRWRACE